MADEQQLSLHDPVPFIDLRAQHASIRDEVQQAVMRVLDSQQCVLGDEVAAFEAAAAEVCDSRYAVGCASGTDALILSLMACGVGPGDEVITSPFTFFATASAIHRVGAMPVFVDIEPAGMNLDPELVEAAITPRTRAIIPVHIFGQCADMEPLWRLAVRHKLVVVEDACQAIGAEYRGRRAGVLGSMGCFSFFPTKNLGGAGDGGLVTTDDAELHERLLRLRVHGDLGGYNHVIIGLNSRLDAIQAAILSAKLPHLADWTAGRQTNARRYGELLRHYGLIDAVEPPSTLPEREHVYNQYVVRIHGGQRDAMMKALRASDIGCAVYYPTPLHLQECFRHLGYAVGSMPQAEQAAAEVLALPVFPELQAHEQERVVQTMARALGRLTDSGSVSQSPRFPAQDRRAA